MTGAAGPNYMDRFLGWLESTTPSERLAATATSPAVDGELLSREHADERGHGPEET